MIVFVDDDQRIKAVGHTSDETLHEVFIDETADSFPFEGWSTYKLCCFIVTVEDGIVIMKTPYRDSSTLDYIDEIGHEADEKTEALKILFGEI